MFGHDWILWPVYPRLFWEGRSFTWVKEEGNSVRLAPWTPVSVRAVEERSMQSPVLQILDFSKDIVLVTGASDVAVSAILHQKITSPYILLQSFNDFGGNEL